MKRIYLIYPILVLSFLFFFFFSVSKIYASTLFQDNFQDANNTVLSAHDSHWGTASFATSTVWGEYAIHNNTAGDGSGSLYDANQLNGISLPSHFIVSQDFTHSPNIIIDSNQAFVDIRLNDESDSNSAVFRFYPTQTTSGNKLESLGNISYHYTSDGRYNPTGSNTVSIEYNDGLYTATINGVVALSFSDIGFIPHHIIISQHINTANLTNFTVSDSFPTVTPTPTSIPTPTPTFVTTLFQDNFHDTNGTILSVHDSHWGTFISHPEWAEYAIYNNTARDGSAPLFDANRLNNITLTSHFIILQDFILSPSILPDGNQAFMDIRINDATDTHTAVFRFYPSNNV